MDLPIQTVLIQKVHNKTPKELQIQRLRGRYIYSDSLFNTLYKKT